ncbi:MAG: lysophospholipid acyltransferase family protein [Angustibacter sp.]
MFYWLLRSVILGPLLRVLFRPWISGAERIPVHGGAVLASNHLSFSDSIFLPLLLDRQVTFLAKADYFTGTGIKGRLTAWFFRMNGQLPVDRAGGQASEAALHTGLRVLSRGGLLGIYPEGTRSPDGRLYRGKTGVARIALEAGVPVIPVVMVGTDKAQPIGRRLPTITQVGVRIGEPLDFSRYEGMENDRFVLRSITDEIMYALMELSGQEYVDVYAVTMKERLAATMKERLAAARKGRHVVGLSRPDGSAGGVGLSKAPDAAAGASGTARPAPPDHGRPSTGGSADPRSSQPPTAAAG